MLSGAPFVLLDDARMGAAPARLYRDPVRIVEAWQMEDVGPALQVLRAARAEGLHAAGWLAYEAAAALEPKLGIPSGETGPLMWFGLFRAFALVDAAALLPDGRGAWIGGAEPLIDRAAYDAAFAEVQRLIAAGDLYQANLTLRARVRFAGDPLAVYALLRTRQGAGYGAVIATGRETILSLSPELFFALENGVLTARPMKGTVRRGGTAQADAALARTLAADAKQRAENLMIVDLLRNDLSRVAEAGSVAVPRLFAVESYPTVHQLVSEVAARLMPSRDAVDVLAALFPCGSITGAPKIRAMQAIAAIEGVPRGAYTGAIGRLDADGDAAFNVAIRTLVIEAGSPTATLGIGSGIVADSQAAEEWDEVLAKAEFLRVGERRFDLIETMAFDPEHGVALLERHLERMKESAATLGFVFDRHGARNELQAATFRLRRPAKLRLLLSRSGRVAVEIAPLPPAPVGPVAVAVVPLPVEPEDFRLVHKTSDRGFYDAARRAAGRFEVIFERADGLLTEGSFTSLFVPRKDGVLLTPPSDLGLLPGVLRADLLASGRAIEAPLTRRDLSDRFYLGNAVRGLVPAATM